MPQTLIELAGSPPAPLLHLAPANGFPPQTYLPLLRGLNGYRCVCLPPRALWGDELPPTEYRDWSEAADDLLAGLARYDLRDIVAVGHSLGGIISLLALIKQPMRFRALILLDPVFLAPTMLRWLEGAWRRGTVDQLPLVQGARRRRRHFDSREQALERFRAKAVFADWPAESLRLYVEHGLRPRRDEPGFELAWSTEWEAHYFATVHRDIWRTLPRLNGLAPTLILRASHSDTFPAEVLDMAQSLLPAADFHEMIGQGHLFPQAAPKETADLIRGWLAAL